MITRELITKLGFTIDKRKFDAYERLVARQTKSLRKLGEESTKLGKSLSTTFSLPAIALGGFAVKLASDANEIESKFSVIFRSISEESEKTAQSLAKNFGLSIVQSKELLGNTADLLTGFGFTQKSALDLANQVNELAVDLASFNNFSGGAEGASAALTKALLGERESVKSLGIQISEDLVKRQVAINNTKGLTFETLRQAKAFATLQIAQRQSLNAVGDYSRTQKQFANRTRELRVRLQDLGVAFGKILLPFATKLLNVTIKLTEFFTNLSPTTKKLILFVTGLTIAFGGLLLTFGLLSGAFITATGAIGKLVLVLKSFSISALAAQASALAIPLAIAAGVAALALAIQDIISFFQGKDSVTEIIVNKFKEAFDKVGNLAKNLFNKSIFGKITNFLVKIGGSISPSGLITAVQTEQAMQAAPIIPNTTNRNQNNNISVKIESPITVDGSGDPQATGEAIVNALNDQFKTQLFNANRQSNFAMEY
jgi:hypothetical protein